MRRRLADLADVLLASLLEGLDDGFAIVAVGGYGRRTLAPGSDLDVLLLHDNHRDAGDLVTGLLYPLWDAGLAIDHSVRTVALARSVAASDLRAALGLLDARHVAGDASLTNAVRTAVLADWRGHARRRLPELRVEAEARAQHHGDLAFLLEGDLKHSRGGLRDVTALRAVAASWLADLPHATVDVAEQVLLDVRDALHRVLLRAAPRRVNDRLLLQEQDAVACLLHLPDADALVQQVAEAARVVDYAGELTWRQVERALVVRSPSRRWVRRGPLPAIPLAEHVAAVAGEVVLTADAEPGSDPGLVLRAAAAAATAALPLAPPTLERLAAESSPIAEPWSERQRGDLVALLGAGRGLVRVWESLDQSGLAARLIPEWRRLRSLPQRNALHRWTVDRHLVETAVEASARTRRVRRPDLLLLGGFLHDVGKGLPGDHSEQGTPLAARVAERIGLPPADVATVAGLVRHHLLLPDVATRRDLADPATVAAVVQRVADVDTLELLATLTEADAVATGTGAWSPWRAQLVGRLVLEVRRALGGERVRPAPELPDELRDMVGRSNGTPLVEVRRLAAGEGVHVAVAATDRTGLLGTVTGALAVQRLAVRTARTYTVDTTALMSFTAVHERGEAVDGGVLTETLHRALDGGLDVARLVARRAAAYPAPPPELVAPPSARIVPDASDRWTVLELRAHDRPGLVHLASSALGAAGVDVRAAVVDTLGAEAVDAFYLSGEHGDRLDDASAARVVEAVVSAVSRG